MKYNGSLWVCLIITFCSRSQRAPSAFDKVSYFMLACVSVKWERVRLIDRRSVEMMHFPCDCFHSHYSQHRVISRPAADTSACACVTEPSLRRVQLPLPQHWSLIAGLNQTAKIMDYVHSYQSACQGTGSHEGQTAAVLFMKEAGGLLEISVKFCLLEVIVLPVDGILGGIRLCCPWPVTVCNEREGNRDEVSAWPFNWGNVHCHQPVYTQIWAIRVVTNTRVNTFLTRSVELMLNSFPQANRWRQSRYSTTFNSWFFPPCCQILNVPTHSQTGVMIMLFSPVCQSLPFYVNGENSNGLIYR